MESPVAPAWQLIPIDQFSRPGQPAAVAVRKGFRSLLGYLFKSHQEGANFLEYTSLEAVPRYLLERAAAEPDWQVLEPAVENALQPWLEDKNALPLKCWVHSPYSGVPQALTAWARKNNWRVITPPSPDQILRNPLEWFAQFEQNLETPFVIPELAHFYLRHHAGLELMRNLVDLFNEGRQRCVVSCDAWAWAYLGKALQLRHRLPTAQTLAALEADHLASWFSQLASGVQKHSFVFRQADNGKFVLSPTHEQEDRTPVEFGDYMRHLAAYSRGIPGVAWAIWRQCLQYDVDNQIDEKALEAAGSDQRRTLWVKKISQLEFLNQPLILPQTYLFVLHALLLHAGLSRAGLDALQNSLGPETWQSLQALLSRGMVEACEERWFVSPLFYPFLRAILEQEGYLCDPL